MNEIDVKIELSGKVTFTENITVIQAAQIIAYLGSGTAPAPTPLSAPLGLREEDNKKNAVSPRDAMTMTGAKSNPERIVALIKQLVGESGQETFNLDDVRQQFRRAREPQPANASRDVDTAIQLGWIGVDAKGLYFLQAVTDDVLETGFEPLRKSRVTTKRAGSTTSRARKSGIEMPESLAGLDSLPDLVEGVAFRQMPTRKEKMLWAIAALKQLGLETVTPKEIEWITNELREPFEAKHVGTYYGYLYKDNWANKSLQNGGIRISVDGETHLRALAAGDAGE
jgi:hypothetical protein